MPEMLWLFAQQTEPLFRRLEPQMRAKVATKAGVVRDRKVLLHQQKDLRWEVRNAK